MCLRSWMIDALALTISCTTASPIDGSNLEQRNPSNICTEIKDIVEVLEINKATASCDSYLQISTVTSTVLETVALPSTTLVTTTDISTETVSVTVTLGSTSTSYVFLPGNPPAPSAQHCEAGPEKKDEWSPKPVPAGYEPPIYLPSDYSPSLISAACSCLEIPIPTTTVTLTTTSNPATTVLTTTTTTTTLTISPSLFTKTIYPCATLSSSLPSPGPAYLLSNHLSNTNDPPNINTTTPNPSPPAVLGLQNGTANTLFPLSTPQGHSPTTCCHACFFELEYCVQSFWYFYQGCVVMVASDFGEVPGRSGEVGVGRDEDGGRSKTCPRGLVEGLVYGPDVGTGPFRSTGDIGGACGVGYTGV